MTSTHRVKRVVESGASLGFRRGTGETFAVSTFACTQVGCACRKMVMEVRRERQRSRGVEFGRAPGAMLQFDADRGTVEPAPEGKTDLSPSELAWITEELRQPGALAVLAERWIRHRGQDCPGALPEHWQVGNLAVYTEVFPAGWDLVVQQEGENFLAVDQYCLNPGCRCSDVTVSFVRLGAGTHAGTVTAAVPGKREAHDSGHADVRALWRALLKSIPPNTLRKRFRRMREFARSLVPRIAPLPRPSTAWPTPRDPLHVSERVHLLRVHVLDTVPAVWRRIEVASARPLAEVARALATAFGEANPTARTFTPFTRPDGNVAFRACLGRPLDLATTLDAAAPLPGTMLRVEAPGSDTWTWEIVVESVHAASPDVAYPSLLDGESTAHAMAHGKRAYHDWMGAFYIPNDAAHEDAVRILGEAFDPDLLPDDAGVPSPSASTDVPVGASDIAPLLAVAGPLLMRRTRERVADLGDAAASALVAIVSTELQRASTTRTSEPTWSLVHALDLLGELGHVPAVELALGVIERFPADSLVMLTAGAALEEIGLPALEPMLAVHARQVGSDRQVVLREALASLGVHDRRILELLLGALRADEPMAAPHLATYGDSGAIPALREALKEVLAVRAVDLEDQIDAASAIGVAIEDLGGRLEPREEKAVDELLARLGATAGAPSVASSKKLGRNDACWCGNGKKYKKCHLSQDEKVARPHR